MKPTELAMQCKRAIESGQEDIVVVLPRNLVGQRRMRLAGARSPWSTEVLSWTGHGTACAFNAVDVLAWLAANGAVQVIAEVKP